MLVANGVNMRNDMIISLSVLAGLFFSFILDMPVLDSVTALLVSLFIIRSAIMIFMDSNVELMDGVKDVSGAEYPGKHPRGLRHSRAHRALRHASGGCLRGELTVFMKKH